MRIAYLRGRYVDEIQRRLGDGKGTMLAAGLTEGEAQSYLDDITDGTAVIGCVNSSTSITISGDDHVLTRLEGAIQKDGKFARKLRVTVAYHSPHMQVVADDFLQSMGSVETLTEFSIPMFSSVTEKVVLDPRDLNAAYWVKNMVSAVRFCGAVTNLLTHSTSHEHRRRKAVDWSAIVEVGPHETLKGPLNQIMAVTDKKLRQTVTYWSLIKRKQDAELTAMEAAGQLWCLGHSVDIARVNGEESGQDLKTLVDLPPYPWQHSKGFWHESPATRVARFQSTPRIDLLGVPVNDQNALEPRWRNYLRLPENPWMEDHVITGTVLYPAAGMLAMVLEAACQMADSTQKLAGIDIQDVVFDRGLIVPSADLAVETSLSIRPHERFDNSYHWTVFSMPPGGSWMKHSFGTFSIIYEQPQSDIDPDPESVWKSHITSFKDIKSRASKSISPSSFYEQLESIGMGYGPLFRNLIEAAAIPGQHTGHGTIEIPDTKSSMPRECEFPHLIHPATLDAIFHLIFIALFEGEPMEEASIPVTMERMFIAAELPRGAGSKYSGFSKAVRTGTREGSGELILSDESWTEAKVIVENMIVRKVSSGNVNANQTSPKGKESPKRVAQMEWKEDVDYLKDSNAQNLLIKESWKYGSTGLSGAGAQLGVWLDRACHKHADLKVLVVNAQDNLELLSLTEQFAPRSIRGLCFKECLMLEDSKNAYHGTEQVLNQNALGVDLELLDLQEATQDQIVELGTFDLILTGTRELSVDQLNLKPMKLLLRPEGKLALLSRKVRGSTDEAGLSLVLQDAGFDSPSIFIRSEAIDLTIAPVKLEENSKTAVEKIRLLLPPTNISSNVSFLKEKLSKHLSSLGIAVETTTLSDTSALKGSAIISLLEVETPFVLSWNEDELLHFRELVTSASYLLWVTSGGSLDACARSLQFAPTTGLLRTIRVEVPQITLPHLDLSPSRDITSDSTVELLAAALMSSTKVNANLKKNEMEMVDSNGNIFIPRVITSQSLDLELELHSEKIRPVQGRLHDSDRALKLEKGIAEAAESLRWTTDEDAAEPLLEEHIEIRTTHVSLNPSDLDAMAGKILGTFLGREAVGIVSKVGSGVVKFNPGDRVVVLNSHSFRTHLRQHQKLVQKVPDSVQSEVAVALPSSFITAYHALIDVARLRKEESVLIDTAAGGFGQAAIQLANYVGGDVFVTVESRSKKDLLIEHYGLAEDHVFDSQKNSFTSKIMRTTEGKGFEVILSSCSGAALHQISSCLGEFGRFIDVGRTMDPRDLHPASFHRNSVLASIDLDRNTEEKRANLLSVLFEMLEQGQIGEIFPTTHYSVSELPTALDVLKTSDHSGKLVVSLEEDAIVPLLPQAPPSLELKSDATYVVSGGLGALGLTIAENMCLNGARHLVLLSRSGASTSEQQEALQSLRDRGCKVDTPICDVTDASQLKTFIEAANQNAWNLKGVVQCAMVLRVRILRIDIFNRV